MREKQGLEVSLMLKRIKIIKSNIITRNCTLFLSVKIYKEISLFTVALKRKENICSITHDYYREKNILFEYCQFLPMKCIQDLIDGNYQC